jgi:leucyl/phenylalanyl-tRNA--protein transferase
MIAGRPRAFFNELAVRPAWWHALSLRRAWMSRGAFTKCEPMALLLDPTLADEVGLVAMGGDLRPETLVRAYCRGIFPWYDEGWPVCWWSPDPRAIFELDRVHVSRRLARTLRNPQWRCTIDQAFNAVIHGCAEREDGTWITNDMIAAYKRLHELGLAHSVEAWRGGELAGGIYGVALRGFFAGESMFTRIRDGSKVALAFLVEHLKQRGFSLFDIQMLTAHTVRLGAVEVPRTEYLERLRGALGRGATFT